MPVGDVTYEGSAAGVAQTAEAPESFIAGDAVVNANITNGSVNGMFTFNEDVTGSFIDDNGDTTVGFTGSMTGNKANHQSSAVAYNGDLAATGQVIGGFFGPGYGETAGAIDIQDAVSGTKITGSFGASDPAAVKRRTPHPHGVDTCRRLGGRPTGLLLLVRTNCIVPAAANNAYPPMQGRLAPGLADGCNRRGTYGRQALQAQADFQAGEWHVSFGSQHRPPANSMAPAAGSPDMIEP